MGCLSADFVSVPDTWCGAVVGGRRVRRLRIAAPGSRRSDTLENQVMWDPPSMSSMFFVVSSLVSLRARSRHADALGRVPTSYLPTGGLVDSLDARVDDRSPRRTVRRRERSSTRRSIG